MKKFLAVIFFVCSLFVMSVACAETETYTGKGKATMSEAETLEKVTERAKTYALRNAQEKAGVYIRSRSELRDLELVEDEVVTLTSGILKIKEFHNEKTLVNGVIQVIVTLTVTIDSDDLQREIDKFLARNPNRKPAPPIEQPANPPAPPTKKKNLQIPADAVQYNGHHYYIYPGIFATWEEAKHFCEQLGGYLAIINDTAENSALFNYMKSKGYMEAYFGLSDAPKEGTWTWVTGESVNYINWGGSEPNGGTYENYGMFYAWAYPNGEWNDGDFTGAKEFICEWDS